MHVANLSRLHLEGEEIDRFADQISRILEYVASLEKVDTTGVEPTTHAISLTNAFREDHETGSIDRDRALANAPEQEDGTFTVPKIIT